MGRAKVYRHVGRAQSVWGLEPVDAIALAILLWALLTFHRGAFLPNLCVIALAYLGLRFAKRGKPTGYTLHLVRYALRRSAFLSAAAPDLRGRSHPFTPGARPAAADGFRQYLPSSLPTTPRNP